ncbi:SHOCT domain-containing protein [Desulfopila inferna]|uniref:SHOCT domain-containing protein n=1 Tax=Desulfopila inferna TaxID=468528 RepID=UPI001964813F|nr:SHOCT domain-containing protein [Desulfopila inferna]MBM9606318.1 SHOCT domain-containing protein [Desulfopila inferna]
MMHWFGNHGYGMGGFGWIFMILFWIVIFVLIFNFIKILAQRNPDRHSAEKSHESAEDILKKRYARGEIKREEYERMKKDISS